ncbi:alpha/beta hydrolase [Hylemonella gracilis]|uniref:Alpha/beta hydrolase n=1 Tax=Hylemonella gracilis TaxID=80880 RepID=A0A4P6UMG8_9BURK|nr:alpha/beta hydrolase [Hylemonella gracilis]QBK05390.1 alpha/beta hydrolase [Hylemonella gracilis]
MTQAVRILIVPGWRDSGPGHWQTLWAERYAHTVRVQQDDWLKPAREAWVGRIRQTILAQVDENGQPLPVVVVAHSLGCIAVNQLPEDVETRIRGALLVAPADPERRSILSDFAPVPSRKLPYRSIVVASNNDPYCPIRLCGAYARSWGSEFVRVPDAGHINIESGHGEWPLGLALLQSLVASDAGEGGLRRREPLASLPI